MDRTMDNISYDLHLMVEIIDYDNFFGSLQDVWWW